MGRLHNGWRIQLRVIRALLMRELTTRFGRENIGFLWIMVEPLLFAGLVALIWRVMKGPEEHGVSVIGFAISGYIPITLFRNAVSRCISVFTVNGSLLYHRQIKIIDFIFVRVMIEIVGGMMAFTFLAATLSHFGLFPFPADLGMLILGWLLYCFFTLSICLIISPLSEMSEALEKMMPVTVYIMIPFSGTFTMVSWLTPAAQEIMLWSPPVHAMEMIRMGLWGNRVQVSYDIWYPLMVCMGMMIIGLALCRRVRHRLVIE